MKNRIKVFWLNCIIFFVILSDYVGDDFRDENDNYLCDPYRNAELIFMITKMIN